MEGETRDNFSIFYGTALLWYQVSQSPISVSRGEASKSKQFGFQTELQSQSRTDKQLLEGSTGSSIATLTNLSLSGCR